MCELVKNGKCVATPRRRDARTTLACTLAGLCLLVFVDAAGSSRLPLEVFQHHPEHMLHHHRPDHLSIAAHHFKPEAKDVRVLYQVGSSEADLPECSPHAVCSKVDLYDTPWLERQCRCAGRHTCPNSAHADDGHTLSDKTRHYKLCEPVKKLPKCRYFRDATWTLISSPDNATEQIVHCHCPKNSVTYLIKRQAFETAQGQLGYKYSFACSPQSRLRCQRKEPCRLFTVRKRQELLDEVNTNTLCQCPHAHHCPRHHTEAGVLPGKSYTEEAIRTYSSYCMPINPMD